ncbi:MAG: cytochrome C assembly protein [Chloroflexi bacterium]|nr:cytochrome C assembly protein [Chloroflexota bacterium]|tara:strand:+ start:9242 stop:9970 length:729 start_codon:yes stop_codon:yes gene_type:complete
MNNLETILEKFPSYFFVQKLLPVISFILIIAFLAGAFLYAPTEVVEGDVQRIFYFHLPTALASYFCFGLTCLFSVFFLWKKQPIYNHWAKASAIIGIIFTCICLWSGMAWGKPVWGVWWTWDARLTSTLILLLLYVGYLLIHALDPLGEGRYSKIAAFIGAISFLDIPLINMSVRWWRTLHPQPIVLAPVSEERLPTEMVTVLLISIIAIIILVFWLITINVRIIKNQYEIKKVMTKKLKEV